MREERFEERSKRSHNGGMGCVLRSAVEDLAQHGQTGVGQRAQQGSCPILEKLRGREGKPDARGCVMRVRVPGADGNQMLLEA
jgi:hypothetical protein